MDRASEYDKIFSRFFSASSRRGIRNHRPDTKTLSILQLPLLLFSILIDLSHPRHKSRITVDSQTLFGSLRNSTHPHVDFPGHKKKKVLCIGNYIISTTSRLRNACMQQQRQRSRQAAATRPVQVQAASSEVRAARQVATNQILGKKIHTRLLIRFWKKNKKAFANYYGVPRTYILAKTS